MRIVKVKTALDRREIQQNFHTKITMKSLFAVLVDVESGKTFKGDESGYILAICNSKGGLLEIAYPYVWNRNRFVTVSE